MHTQNRPSVTDQKRPLICKAGIKAKRRGGAAPSLRDKTILIRGQGLKLEMSASDDESLSRLGSVARFD